MLTFDDFLSWEIEALREFLGKRDLTKDKPKRELSALTYSAYTMNLPVLPSAKEREQIIGTKITKASYLLTEPEFPTLSLSMNVGYLNKTA